jgi:sulfite exporter TauE/SafE
MVDKPTLVAERTRRTPGAPFNAVSIGKVTRLSMSSGAMPCASVTTVTVGAVRSGNTSTGVRVVW